MLTSLQCLAKADQLDSLALLCVGKVDRDACADTADGWRRAAIMARQQDEWHALHPRLG
jgi:hypothetical protein